jgi:sugar/nucleoside kinase (ribokinase family)
VIVVVGSPGGRETEQGIVAGGVAAAIARAASIAGAEVQLVGKVGEGIVGDTVLLSLAGSSIGHVAVLRDPSTTMPVASMSSDDEAVLDKADDEPSRPEAAAGVAVALAPPTPSLDAGDLQLALRYLPDYRVVVVADVLTDDALATVVEAARWAGAQLIVVVPSRANMTGIAEDATILEPPDRDPEGAFATVVGAYAAELDRGVSPAEAFTSASIGSGWSAVAD